MASASDWSSASSTLGLPNNFRTSLNSAWVDLRSSRRRVSWVRASSNFCWHWATQALCSSSFSSFFLLAVPFAHQGPDTLLRIWLHMHL